MYAVQCLIKLHFKTSLYATHAKKLIAKIAKLINYNNPLILSKTNTN